MVTGLEMVGESGEVGDCSDDDNLGMDKKMDRGRQEEK